jgi:S1-C subfamily serine protease
MRLRRVLLIVVLVGGFWLVTTHLPHGITTVEGINHLTGLNLPTTTGSGSPLALTEAHAAPAFDSEEQNNIAVYKKGLPSVVNITSKSVQYNFFYGQVPQEGQGSGFILDRSGHVLTNFHVIADANRIEVKTSDKHTYKATIIGSDKIHDLALLQINAPNLQPVTLADSSDLVVGQKVYAIGNPFGLNGTMTRGIISSIRSIRGPEGGPIEDAIQTDAAINPGNSGGPLLNSRGEVIGINTLIATGGAEQSSGIGFAIPINTAKAVLGDLTKFGRVRRPSLGIVSLAVGPDVAEQMGLPGQSGVLIEKVVPGGAAERAGLHGGSEQAYLGNMGILIGGDMIVAIDGKEVVDTSDIGAIMEKHQPGDVVTITVYRGRKKLAVRLTLGDAREVNT